MDEAPGIVASPARIAAWMAVAQAGDRFVYATRMSLPVASAGAKRMRELSDRGLVMLTRPRSSIDPTLFNYTALRTSRPSALVRPARDLLRAPSTALLDGEAAVVDLLLPVLERFAARGRPCPTNAQLAERTGLSIDTIPVALDAMAAANLIRVQSAPRPTLRRIVILSTGAITGIAA